MNDETLEIHPISDSLVCMRKGQRSRWPAAKAYETAVSIFDHFLAGAAVGGILVWSFWVLVSWGLYCWGGF